MDDNFYQKFDDGKNRGGKFKSSVLVPFVSGVVGASLVVGTCFGVPSIKDKLLSQNDKAQETSSSITKNDGLITEVSLQNYSDTAIYAANKALPSIVGISISYNVRAFGITQTAEATGSGVIISEDGYILTNNHVVSSSDSSSYYQVSEATDITVSLYNSDKTYSAKIVGTDKQTDLAIIKIDAEGLTVADIGDSDSVKVGEFVLAVGNPLGLKTSVTSGIVSALGRDITSEDGTVYHVMQTDCAINSGNSGGALVNSEGKVIGINTLKLSGTGIEGMGFAIPINSTTDITSQLIQYSKVKRPYIGISGMDLNEQTAKANNLVVGVYVKSIEDFSAGEKAGIKVGDVIIEADGQKITKMDELNKIKNSHKIGDEMKIKVNRNGQEKDLTITLGEQP